MPVEFTNTITLGRKMECQNRQAEQVRTPAHWPESYMHKLMRFNPCLFKISFKIFFYKNKGEGVISGRDRCVCGIYNTPLHSLSPLHKRYAHVSSEHHSS